LPRVRLPRSAIRRGADDALLLLRKVDPRQHGAFRLVSEYLPPGRFIDEETLYRAPDWPLIPLLLEITQCPLSRGRPGGCVRDYILWRYVGREFQELGRWCSKTHAFDWDVLPAVEAALVVARRGLPPPPPPDLLAAAETLVAAIGRELYELNAHHQQVLLSILWDALARRSSAAAGEILTLSA
jgi:hypothetical protein